MVHNRGFWFSAVVFLIPALLVLLAVFDEDYVVLSISSVSPLCAPVSFRCPTILHMMSRVFYLARGPFSPQLPSFHRVIKQNGDSNGAWRMLPIADGVSNTSAHLKLKRTSSTAQSFSNQNPVSL